MSALSSLVFLPSREARCCSRASRRLLGALQNKEGVREEKVEPLLLSFFFYF